MPILEQSAPDEMRTVLSRDSAEPIIDTRPLAIVFCQASMQTQYVLSVYAKKRQTHRIRIYIIGVTSLHRILRRCCPDSERVISIPYPKLSTSTRNPLHIFRTKQLVSDLIRTHFEGINDAEVYYWENYFDWFTFSFLSGLSNSNKLLCCQLDKSTFTPLTSKSIMERLTLFVYKYLTGCPVTLVRTKRMSYSIPHFPAERYGVKNCEVTVSPETMSMFQESVSAPSKKSILLFEVPSPRHGCEYEGKMRSVIEALLEHGYTVFVKGHPRLGYSAFLDEYSLQYLESSLPAELLSLKGFCGVLGVATTCLATIKTANPNLPVISLLDMFSLESQVEKEGFREYLTGLNPNIHFASDVQSLLRALGRSPSHLPAGTPKEVE